LLDALSHGFSSVEADVFLLEGKLLIGHDPTELRPDRTLRSLYLDPLRRLVERNKGSVHPKGGELFLLIDIKTDGKATWEALARELDAYREILTEFRDGKITRRAVTAVVSGNRDFDAIARTSPRYAGVDGRLSDLDLDHPPSLMPLVSDHFGRHFTWRGEGPIPAAERAKLERIVSRAHAKGYRVRFWATPESRSVWEELLRADVDHINTDDLAGLERFLREAGDVESAERASAKLETKERDGEEKPTPATPHPPERESPETSDE
ncbi:MAG TPA: phosphatidylinositol-specific phospholipase C/glycerophosphodiester phosphodiesterase family protein, partial [Planctomycetota bacterium]|nr:phosphatidylinositol-specific phospholipase C/glycerophosphodiester phosphodiesterase family protein [Planctomycetota bacterium]